MTDLNNFKLSKYPLFALLMCYAWIESTNIFVANFFQIIPKVNSAHIAIGMAWILLPKELNRITLPKSKF